MKDDKSLNDQKGRKVLAFARSNGLNHTIQRGTSLRSFLTKFGARRAVYLRLVVQIEGQLRDAYYRRFYIDKVNQSSPAKKLGVGRSVVHRRLTGQQNMTSSTVAYMVWGLDCVIDVKIYDAEENPAVA